jgi:hypothetical protein
MGYALTVLQGLCQSALSHKISVLTWICRLWMFTLANSRAGGLFTDVNSHRPPVIRLDRITRETKCQEIETGCISHCHGSNGIFSVSDRHSDA